jgi:hypothetical protein
MREIVLLGYLAVRTAVLADPCRNEELEWRNPKGVRLD